MASGPRVYSERFIKLRGSNVTELYHVPPGKRAVVRCISVANLSTSQGNGALFVSGVLAWFWLSPETYGSRAEDVRLVAYAGEGIQLSLEGPDVAGHVAGYLFDDPALTAGTLPTEPGAIEPQPPVELPPTLWP